MTEITTALARVVWGNLIGRPKVDQTTKQPVLKDGKPVIQYAFGLAIPKADFGPIWQVMVAEGAKIIPAAAQTGQFPASFALKYVDGDGLDSKGVPFSNREGYAGCFVLAISTEAFQPQLTQLVGPNQYQNIPAETLKTGYFVRVALDIQSHGVKPGVPTSKAGLYLNPRLVELVAGGAEIFNGPDASEAFGGAPVTALPPGAFALTSPGAPGNPQTPPQPAIGLPPGFPAPVPMGMPAPAAVPPPAIPAAPPMTPPAGPVVSPLPTAFPSSPPAVAPAYDFVAGATGQPAMPGMPAPVPMAPPPPVAPAPAPATPQYFVPMGQPIPAGYRLVGYSPDGKNQIITTP